LPATSRCCCSTRGTRCASCSATTQPPPLGRHVHYVSIGQRRAGEPAHTVVHRSQTEGSSECVLEVLKVSEGGGEGWGWGAGVLTAAMAC
jgi:hypothetical protein